MINWTYNENNFKITENKNQNYYYKYINKARLPRWLCGKESTCQCKRHGFDPWVGKILWTRKWQHTPVFLPRKSHGQRSLVGGSSRDCKESDTTEHTHIKTTSISVESMYHT